MRAAFPGAAVRRFGHLEPLMGNQKRDRHVLAAAVKARASVIVTNNVKHFRPEACAPYGITVRTPDQFLQDCLRREPERVIAGLQEQASRFRDPPRTVEELLTEDLSRPAPRFVAAAQTEMRYQANLDRRVAQIESDPKTAPYLQGVMKRPPQDEEGKMIWRQGVRRVERYRDDFGVDDPTRPLGRKLGLDPDQQAARATQVQHLWESESALKRLRPNRIGP